MGIKLEFKFVPMPQNIWDDGIDLSLAEFRLLGYLIRRQVRFGRSIVPLSYDELMNGPWYEGRRMDKGCGLSRNSLKQALSSLEGRGWVAISDLSPNPRLPKVVVEVLLGDDGISCSSSDSDDRVSKSDTTPSSDSHDGISCSSSDSDDLYKEVKEKERVEERPSLPKDKPSAEELSFHSLLRGDYDVYYQHKNKTPAPWDGKEAAQLSKWIKANPTLTRDQWREILQNRARSPVAHAKPLSVWIGVAVSWLNGLADDWGKAITGGSNGAVPTGKANQNMAVLQRALDRRKRDGGAHEDGVFPAGGDGRRNVGKLHIGLEGP